jgi:hypothetical protein
MSALSPKADIVGGEYASALGAGVASGFVGAKHIQLCFVYLAAHSSIVIGLSLIA